MAKALPVRDADHRKTCCDGMRRPDGIRAMADLS
jgi:hypothetical protein